MPNRPQIIQPLDIQIPRAVTPTTTRQLDLDADTQSDIITWTPTPRRGKCPVQLKVASAVLPELGFADQVPDAARIGVQSQAALSAPAPDAPTRRERALPGLARPGWPGQAGALQSTQPASRSRPDRAGGLDPGQHLVEVLEGPDRALRPPGKRLAGLLDCSHVQSSFCLGSRPGWTGCDQRAGPRRKRLSPGRRNVCHLAHTTGRNPAATLSQRQRATVSSRLLGSSCPAGLSPMGDKMHDPFPLSSENSDSEEQTAGMTPENVPERPQLPLRWPACEPEDRQ